MLKKLDKNVVTEESVEDISKRLQDLQRQRQWHMKSRIMVSNRLQATVAGMIGYDSGMKEKERAKVFSQAGKLMLAVSKGKATCENDLLVMTTYIAIDGFLKMQKSLEVPMQELVKRLPVIDWVEHVDQRGFGVLYCGVILGETGDLFNYANPAKVWRRLGVAPYTKGDETLMGATWKSRGKSKGNKLHKLDWEEFGYSPRRRSITYLLGESLLKGNQNGPYRTRYTVKREEFQKKHPEYEKPMRSHLHGMLLASKLLLKNLWIEWWK